MCRRLAFHLCLLALLLGNLNVAVPTRAAPPLPVCQPWQYKPHLHQTPTVAQDNAFFIWGGYPLGRGLTLGGLKSTDRGLTWQQFNNPGRGNVVFSTNFKLDRTLVVLTTDAGYISNDDGVSWRAIAFPVTTDYHFALGDARHLFLSYGRLFPPDMVVPPELLASNDGGKTWQHIPMGLEVDEIAVSPGFTQDHSLLMALGAYKYNGGLIKSTDAGLTWAPADTGIIREGLGIKYLRFSPAYASDHTIFCFNYTGTIENKIYQSTDAGATWRFLADPELFISPAPPGLLLSPRFALDQTMWLSFDFMAKVSRDGGQTWQDMPYSGQIWLQTAAEYCRPAGECGVEVFGTSWQKGATWEDDRYYMYRSYDYGATWQCLEDPTPPGQPPPVEIPEPASGLLLAAGLAALAGVARQRQQRR